MNANVSTKKPVGIISMIGRGGLAWKPHNL